MAIRVENEGRGGDTVRFDPNAVQLDDRFNGRYAEKGAAEAAAIEALARSIAEQGQIEPGIVRRSTDGTSVILVVGSRRLAACRLLRADPARYFAEMPKTPPSFEARLLRLTDEQALEMCSIPTTGSCRVGRLRQRSSHPARSTRFRAATARSSTETSRRWRFSSRFTMRLLDLPRYIRVAINGTLKTALAWKLFGLPERAIQECWDTAGGSMKVFAEEVAEARGKAGRKDRAGNYCGGEIVRRGLSASQAERIAGRSRRALEIEL